MSSERIGAIIFFVIALILAIPEIIDKFKRDKIRDDKLRKIKKDRMEELEEMFKKTN